MKDRILSSCSMKGDDLRDGWIALLLALLFALLLCQVSYGTDSELIPSSHIDIES